AASVDVQAAVAADLLRAIERFVRSLDQPREAALRAGLGDRRAEAHGDHVRRVGIGVRDAERHDFAAERLRERGWVDARGRIQDEREFLAAVTGTEVERTPRRARDHVRYSAYAVVAGLVAVEVVEAFEVVDVDKNDLQRLFLALRLLPEPARQ